MIVLHVPTFKPGQTVLTFAERPMVPCPGASYLGTCKAHGADGPHGVPLAPGTRIAIAVPCKRCGGSGWKPCQCGGRCNWGDIPHERCDGLGSLIVASGVVRGVFQQFDQTDDECRCGFGGFHDDVNPRCPRNHSTGWEVYLTDVLPITERCPACWGRMLHDFNCDAPNGPIPVACTGDVTIKEEL